MINIIVDLSKYINILLIACYTYCAFRVLGYKDKQKQKRIYSTMARIIYSFHFVSYLILFIRGRSVKIALLYGAQVVLITLVLLLYQWIYHNLSKLILHNMVFLLTIGYTILTRLSYDKALKQFFISGITLIICLVIPIIIDKLKYLKKFGWAYGVLGVLMLLSVFIWGVEQYGATNWIKVAGISLQPSEFVKIIFVFCIAGLLSKRKDFRYVVVVTALAALHVLILVLEKDLGGALIYFVTYLVMLYIATKSPVYFFLGLGAGSVASFIAYNVFYHVKVRVMAWSNPWAYIDREGYQVTQSLFAIGTGGWFGMGLTKGLPTSIPVVDSDFIFSAISEEMGGIFALCLVLICISCFIMFVLIAMKLEDEFYRIIAMGLSVMYIFQIFLSIGGVTKFIPSTGVTLPLISYGGSSMLSSLIMFHVMQGLNILSQDRNDGSEKKRKQRKEKDAVQVKKQARS